MAHAWIDDGIVVYYGGIDFRSRHNPNPHVQWGLETISGWWDGAEEDSDTLRQGRGVRRLTEHYGPRMITWTGLLETRERESLLEQIARFESAWSTTMQVEEGPRSLLLREATVRRMQGLITPVSDTIATYSMTVQADDPLLYSGYRVKLARVAKVRNVGNTRSYPVVVVTGPTAGPPYVKIGDSWNITAPRALRKGESMVVDCSEQQMYVGGDPVYPLRADWPSIRVQELVQVYVNRGDAYVKRVSAWR